MDSPNILFVFADQLRYTALGLNGNPVVRTPHLDGLAADGLVFDQAFSSCPICSPYRGQILTGRYSHANGVVCNEYRMADDQVTIAHALREHGYRTAYIGKLHLNHGPYPEAKRLGFDDMIAYNCTHSYYKVRYFRNEEGPIPMPGYAPQGETDLTLGYIREHRAAHPDQPFCIFLSWGPPHWTGHAGKDGEYADYPREYATYDPETVDVPENIPPMLRDYAAREIADYYGMVTSLDDCIGRILADLEAQGLAENTIVCFSSDHGDHIGAHGYGKPGCDWMPWKLRASKATPYDESVHIPFIMRYPGKVAAGRRTTAFLNSVDVMPTLLGLAGVPVPETVQGTDLSHVATGGEDETPDSVYLQILGPGWPDRTAFTGLWRGVRTAEYTYARWQGGKRALYDLARDPGELRNVVGDPAYEQAAEGMEKRLQQWMAATDDPFDTGPRLPQTNMLDLGQQLTSEWGYGVLPPAYAAAIESYHPPGLE